MSYEKSDSFLVRFNGKKYSAWEFQFKLFVKGKDLWGHIDEIVIHALLLCEESKDNLVCLDNF